MPGVALPHTERQWGVLANCVQSWLQATVAERSTKEWTWRVNYFWICYVGCYPLFPSPGDSEPYGDWLVWDLSVIPLEGDYIYSRFTSMVRGALTVPADSNRTRTKMLVTWFEVRDQSIKDGMSSNQSLGEVEDQY